MGLAISRQGNSRRHSGRRVRLSAVSKEGSSLFSESRKGTPDPIADSHSCR